MSTVEAAVTWDLSDLYGGLDDPRILGDCRTLLERAEAFESRYRGRIAAPDCDAATLRAALDQLESIWRELAKPRTFASLAFSADTSDAARGALLQKTQEEGTAVTKHLIFFDLEIGAMPEENFARLAGAPEITEYRHYLEHERRAAKHHLTEAEEKIVQELSNSGVRAFERLFNEISSRARFRVGVKGEERELTQSEVLALLYDPDRDVRKAAAEAFTETLRGQSHAVGFIFNTLLQHKGTIDRLRRYEYPEQSRHEANELDREVVDQMVEVTVSNYDVVADYYELKRKLLGLEELTHYDRYAPVFRTEAQIPFEEARETVLSAFAAFAPGMREMAEPFFTRRWIDAELRGGKRGGAFCSAVTPDLHPYVFMNYTGKARDVMTLAHELGHAIHDVLASKHNYLNFHPTLPLAETASVFAEMLVFERVTEQITDPKEKLALLAGKIEDTFATVFRQVAMFRFEQKAHEARRTEGELPPERYNALWQESIQEMFGGSLKLGEDHAWWWLYIQHVFSWPFYVYAYAFGELLVLALYARYRQEGAPFVQRYFDLLAAGGSEKPDEILARVGIDVHKREFWQGGCDLIREMVEKAKALAGQVSPS